ncbi:MAG TPA: CoA transferase, partial [Novosphingobium sp.]|nr:CoA transferase [Novosphingobium sp.]
LGRTGPYHALRSHAVAYDAYAGLVPADVDSPPPAAHAFRPPSIGMQAPGLFAAVGVLAALLRAHTTGEGAQIEVAAVDAAAHWVPDGVDAAANPDVCQARAGFLDETGRMRHWPRLAQYVTRGGEVLLLEAFARPTWEKFCHLVGRADLLELDRLGLDDATYHARLRQEIAAILIQRTRAEWMAAFIAADISAMPVNDPAALARDPHYLARGNWYEVDLPDVGPVRLNGTPIRLAGATFAPAPAPGLGEHGPAILGEVLGLADGEIAALRACGVVG